MRQPIKKTGTVAIAGKKIISDYIAANETGSLKLILPDDYSETSQEFDLIISDFSMKGTLYILKKSLCATKLIQDENVSHTTPIRGICERWRNRSSNCL